MYVTVRKYAGKGSQAERLIQPVRDGLVPLLKRASGFKGYCVFASQDGHLVSVTIFDNRGAAISANEQVRGWVAATLKDLLPDPPEGMAGECAVHTTVAAQDQGGPQSAMHCVVRLTDNAPPLPQVRPLIERHLLPALRQQAGFLGLYGARFEDDASRVIQVTLWQSAQAAEEGLRVMAAINANQMGGAFQGPTAMMSGTTVVAATA